MSTSRILLNGVPPSSMIVVYDKGAHLPLFFIAIDPLHQILDFSSRKDLIHKIRVRGAMVRTSLYVDDAAVFKEPINADIGNFAGILKGSDEVTGLFKNSHKSLVAPIRCDHIILDQILSSLPTTKCSFPIIYLGFPLLVCKWCKHALEAIIVIIIYIQLHNLRFIFLVIIAMFLTVRFIFLVIITMIPTVERMRAP